MVKVFATNGVEYEALVETCVGDIDHCSNGITSGSYERTLSIEGIFFVAPGNKVLIGIGIIGDGRLEKGIVCATEHDRLVRTDERAIDRNTLSKYFRAVAGNLVPGN